MFVGVVLAISVFRPAVADPGSVHWSGTGDRRITVALNVRSGRWPVAYALKRWSKSPYIDLVLTTAGDPCDWRPRADIDVCRHPSTRSWLGLTSVFHQAAGEDPEHITYAIVEIDGSRSWTWRKKKYVLCHELGHALGLLHRPESADDSCMVSRYPRLVGRPKPDAQDLSDVAAMYSHDG